MQRAVVFNVLYRRLWLICLVTIAAIAAAIVATKFQPPSYTATTTIRVLPVAIGSVDYTEYIYAERLMSTYTEILKTRPVTDGLMSELNLKSLPAIQVEVVPNTELLRISVTSTDPLTASNGANTLARLLIQHLGANGSSDAEGTAQILSNQIKEADQQLDDLWAKYDRLAENPTQATEQISDLRQTITAQEQARNELQTQYENARVLTLLRTNSITVVEPAEQPSAPSGPDLQLNVVIASIVGLIAGTGFVLLLAQFDTRLYTTAEIRELIDLPLLGSIPARRVWFGHGPLIFRKPVYFEAYRRLGVNISATLPQTAQQRCIVITSAEPGEGKSTVVANLACALAKLGRHVLIIDADLYYPVQHRIFKVPNLVGLTNVLRKTSIFWDAIQKTQIPGVWILTAGSLVGAAPDLLSTPELPRLFKLVQPSSKFDFILIDTPPLAPIVDAALITDRLFCETVLVVGRSVAHREVVKYTLGCLPGIKESLIGFVVNYAEREPWHYHHYYQTISSPVKGQPAAGELVTKSEVT